MRKRQFEITSATTESRAAGRTGQDATTDGVAAGVELKEANTSSMRLRLQKEAGELVDGRRGARSVGQHHARHPAIRAGAARQDRASRCRRSA